MAGDTLLARKYHKPLVKSSELDRICVQDTGRECSKLWLMMNPMSSEVCISYLRGAFVIEQTNIRATVIADKVLILNQNKQRRLN